MPYYLPYVAVSGTLVAIVALVYSVIERARRADESELVARQLKAQVESQAHWARRLASIIDASNDAVVDTSLDGTIQSWNPAAESLFGYAAQSALGRNISLLVPPGRLAEHKALMQKVSAGQRLEHVVTERDCADRGQTLVTLTLLPIRNGQGHVVGVSTIARDLPNTISDTRIGGARPEPDQPAPTLAAANELNESLFDFARLVQGRTRLRRHRLWLGPLIDQAAQRARGRCQAAMSVALPSEPLAVDGDKDRLLQVVTHLLNVACQFTDRTRQIDVELTREDDTAVISVRDNGIGIPPEHLPQIFDMFNHAVWSVTETPRSYAVGMALTRLLVQLHGGTIKVESEGAGQGMAFHLHLPIARSAGPLGVVTADWP
jgi:PAS domain S-box-containing protein